jgi:hypothetical protein
MAQYASYDSSIPSPSPVVGWYDTNQFQYPHLPAAADLLEVNPSQWALHYNSPHGFAISNGQLIEYPVSSE